MIEVFKLISKELNKKTVFISVPLKVGVLMARVVKILTLGKIDYIERVQRMGEDRSYSHEMQLVILVISLFHLKKEFN